MEKLCWCFLALINLCNASGQTDMNKKAFVFLKESDNSYVSLKRQLKQPLEAFTVCLSVYADRSRTRSYGIFSYATRKIANEIVIFWSKNGGYSFIVGGAKELFKFPAVSMEPAHICASWESASGIVEFWVDGWPMLRKSLKKGYSVESEANIILGQEQDSFGGGFNINQSLVGEIGDVNMWDFVLSPEQIKTIYSGGTISPTVLDWRALTYETRGEVLIKPQLWS
ncbi:PREDICTED: C-reactive protein [Elephantulus edwardii]|uniref:C-reactive protein n=1 Tax=Elephantulus edwardii TaxID=28737 RepID=UPI0003F0D5E2|nr:PREDICTED: C-reactive protein [Elephantulus edwardii]